MVNLSSDVDKIPAAFVFPFLSVTKSWNSLSLEVLTLRVNSGEVVLQPLLDVRVSPDTPPHSTPETFGDSDVVLNSYSTISSLRSGSKENFACSVISRQLLLIVVHSVVYPKIARGGSSFPCVQSGLDLLLVGVAPLSVKQVLQAESWQ